MFLNLRYKSLVIQMVGFPDPESSAFEVQVLGTESRAVLDSCRDNFSPRQPQKPKDSIGEEYHSPHVAHTLSGRFEHGDTAQGNKSRCVEKIAPKRIGELNHRGKDHGAKDQEQLLPL